MFPIRCSVRNCTLSLARQDNQLGCTAGHQFDLAKPGYWNLLQPQDRKSNHPGDSDAAVQARHRWLSYGHMDPMVHQIAGLLDSRTQLTEGSTILELGCGEGTLSRSLFQSLPADYAGIDLSKRAIKIAVRGWPEATWLVANADRELPTHDGSIDLLASLFGRRPLTEVQRTLRDNGHFLVVVPGPSDLIQLREIVQGEAKQRSRIDQIIQQAGEHSLAIVDQSTWTHTVALTNEQITDALAMTYRAGRNSESQRAKTLDSLEVTLQADILLFAKSLQTGEPPVFPPQSN